MKPDWTELALIILAGLSICLLFAWLVAREMNKQREEEEVREYFKRLDDADQDNRRGI